VRRSIPIISPRSGIFAVHGRSRSNEISAWLRNAAIELNRTLRDMMWLVGINLKLIRCTLCTIYVHSRVALRLCGQRQTMPKLYRSASHESPIRSYPSWDTEDLARQISCYRKSKMFQACGRRKPGQKKRRWIVRHTLFENCLVCTNHVIFFQLF